MNFFKLILIFMLILNASTSWGAKEKKKKTTKRNNQKSKLLKNKKRKNYRPKRATKKRPTVLKQSVRYLEETQSFISKNWVGLNHNLDMYFADERYAREQNKSQIKFSYAALQREAQSMEHFIDFGVRVHFPRVSKKLSLVIEKEKDEILESRDTPATQATTANKNNYTAGVKYQLGKTRFWNTSLDTGLRLLLPLNPFAKFNIYKKLKFSFLNIYMAQKFIYYRQEGFSEVTQLSFSTKLGKSFSLTQNNTLSWADVDDTFVVRNDLGLRHQINEDNNMSYVVGANALLSPTYYYYKYDASIGWRHNLHKGWLYSTLIAGAEFPKSKDFAMENYGLLRLEIYFQ